MTANHPLVSIGLPTYNGARYIREALDSLVAQDYPSLEILVSDNASTDGTPAIVEEYAARDARIRVFRQERNIGAPANFNFVFRETTGPLFMWAADDDRWEPSYVSECVAALLGSPSAVLACTRVVFLDPSGMPRAGVPPLIDNPDLSSPAVERRVHILLSRGGWYTIYGVIRREALASTRLYLEGFGADVVLTLELALLGPFVRVPEPLHQIRLFETRTDDDRGTWHNAIPDRERIRAAPWTHLQEAFSKAIAASPIGQRAKAGARLGMVRAMYLTPTPMRGSIVAEADVRLGIAIRDRDVYHVLKYAGLKAAVFGHHLVPRAARRAGSRLGRHR